MKKDLLISAVAAGEVLRMHGEAPVSHNIVVAANASLLTQGTFQEALSSYALGWKDPDMLDELLAFLAPEVPVGSQLFQFAKGVNAEAFLSESDDIRAIGADFKRVQYSQEMQTSNTQNKGLTVYVDLDQVRNLLNWEQLYTAMLLRRLTRNEIRRAWALLVAAATPVEKTWDSKADPDMDLDDAIEAAADKTGLQPNRCVFGRTAWSKRKKAYRAQDNAGAMVSARMSPSELADELALDEVRVSRERYQTGAASKGKLLTHNLALVFNAMASPMPEDPSSIKRFVSPTTEGGKIRVYRQELSAKIVAITVEHYSRILVTDANGVAGLTIK